MLFRSSLEAAFEATPELANFLYVARSDDSGRPLADFERLVETLTKKSPRGFRWHSQAFPDETHASIPLLAEIDGLRHLYAGYRLHDDLLEKGFAFAQEHFREVSKKVGWTLQVPESIVNDLAYAALEQGRTDEALALFQRNVEGHPNSAAAYDGLADGCAKAEKWLEAAAAAARAERLAVEQDHLDRAYFEAQARKMEARRKEAATKPD